MAAKKLMNVDGALEYLENLDVSSYLMTYLNSLNRSQLLTGATVDFITSNGNILLGAGD